MGYINKNLISGEEIAYKAKIHWAIYAPSIVCFILAILILNNDSPENERGQRIIGIMLILFSIWMAIKSFFYKISTELAVTNKRVIAKTGLIRRNTIELNHSKVESYSVNQSILGRIFGFGTIIISGTGGVKNPIRNIDSPLEFRNSAVLAIDDSQSK